VSPARRRLAVRVGLAAASGILLTLGYPPFALSAVAWVALTPLIVGLDGARPRVAFGLGWLAGTVLGLGVTGYWLWRAAIDYFGLGPITAAAFTTGLIEIFVAPFVALFAVLVAVGPGGAARLLFVPAAFVAGEYARATLAGNAWELLGHSQRALPVLQIADLTGVHGLSCLLALTATALAEPLTGARSRTRLATAGATALAAVGLVLAYGTWRLDHLPPAEGTLRALLVQGNVSNPRRNQPGDVSEVLQRYVALTRSAAPLPPLLIWPENAIAIFPADNAALLAPLRDLVRGAPTALLTGAPRAGDRLGTAAIFNSLYLLTADSERSVYDKRRLLPFVERYALRAADGPYLAGAEAAPVAIGAARVGPLICYEIIYAELARELVASGANLLVNVSNDSWFDAGAGPAQHAELARFRAIENRVSLLRVTNSGVSGAFDPAGREIARLPSGVAVAQAVDVPLVAGGSLYTRYGDWFAWLCIAIVLAGLARRWWAANV
jgi:apolipoprotein N-acyltransferase